MVAENVGLLRWGANCTTPNPLAGFQGPLRGGRKRREREGRKRKG